VILGVRPLTQFKALQGGLFVSKCQVSGFGSQLKSSLIALGLIIQEVTNNRHAN
jgi:hypothetical protein